MHRTIDWKKYIFTFIITATIFGSSLYVANYINEKKLAELRDIQDKISIDILSSETQFALLEDSLCKDVSATTLSSELGSLEQKLSFTEQERGADDEEVQTLKKYYFLLEIKDLILLNKISEKCGKTPLSIIYFYSTKTECPECEKMGYVLTKLRERYPDVRIYSFDYNMDLSALQTLIKTKKIDDSTPALYIPTQEKTYYGFQTIEEIEKNIPALQKLKTEKATSTREVKN